MRPLERVAIALASLALAVGLIALLSGFFAHRDEGTLTGQASGPGQSFANQGNAVLRPGQLRPLYNSNPPTSGPHRLKSVARDGIALTNDQLLTAMSRGNVILLYGTPSAPPPLQSLARSLGAFTPALASAGQAVILSPRLGTHGVIALAWTHMLHVPSPGDPRLRDFAAFWLGRT